MFHHQAWMIRVSAYLDGESGEQEALAVTGHLRICAQCRTEYEGLKILSQRASELRMESDPSPFFEQKLFSRLKEADTPGEHPAWKPSFAVLSALILILLVIASGFGSYAYALNRFEPQSRKQLISEVMQSASARRSPFNLVHLDALCSSCHDAVCEGCGQCTGSAFPKSCCPPEEKHHE